LGVTFPRDRDFAAELSLIFGDKAASLFGARQMTMIGMLGFLGSVLLPGRHVHPLRKKAVIQRDKS
jgi:hypothetical protein